MGQIMMPEMSLHITMHIVLQKKKDSKIKWHQRGITLYIAMHTVRQKKNDSKFF